MRVLAKTKDLSKERFENYRALTFQIEIKKEKLLRVLAKTENPSSSKFSEYPKSPNKPKDKMALMIQEKIEIENRIYKLEKKREKEREELLSAVYELENPENSNVFCRDKDILIKEASILMLRYFYLCSWEEINEAIFGEEIDFELKKENFLGTIFRYHGNAFIDLKKLS